MLRAAANEGAPPEARHRALAALGLLGVAPLAGAVSGGSAIATPATASVKALWWKGWVAKGAWLVGVGGAGIAVGAYSSGTDPRSTLDPSTSPASLPVAKALRDAAPIEPPNPGELEVSESSGAADVGAVDATRPSTKETKRKVGTAARVARTTPSSERGFSIREEIDLLDAARAELRRGDRPAALLRVAEYLRRFPHGELLDEARAIGAEARKTR